MSLTWLCSHIYLHFVDFLYEPVPWWSSDLEHEVSWLITFLLILLAQLKTFSCAIPITSCIHLCHCGQMLTKCKFLREELQLGPTFLQEKVVPSIVNPAHRVLFPTVAHLHKVLREKMAESFSLLRENQNSLFFP